MGKKGYVYFADRINTAEIKIGSTENLDRRLKDLHKEFPNDKFEIYHKIFSRDCEELEKSVFHQMFRSKNTDQEFFTLTLKELELIKNSNYEELLRLSIKNEEERNNYQVLLHHYILSEKEEQKFADKASISLRIQKEYEEKLELIAFQTKKHKKHIASILLEKAISDYIYYTTLQERDSTLSPSIPLQFKDLQEGNPDTIATVNIQPIRKKEKEIEIEQNNYYLSENRFDPTLLQEALYNTKLTEKDKRDLPEVLHHIIKRERASERNLYSELNIKDRRGKRILSFLEVIGVVSSIHCDDYNESKGGRKVNIKLGKELLPFL